MRFCPVDAIQADEDGRVWIDDEKCIRCGSCISKCPFGAISDSSRMIEVIDYLKGDRPVYALAAPSSKARADAPQTICMSSGQISGYFRIFWPLFWCVELWIECIGLYGNLRKIEV